MTKKKKPEYLKFEERQFTEHRRKKTRVVDVVAVHSGRTLGVIAWYAPWRQYTFYPATQTIWNPDCLTQISKYVRRMSRDHYSAIQAAKFHEKASVR